MERKINQQPLPFDQSVADRIQSLLARCERLTRGSDLHTTFDAKGQREAAAIANRDRENNRG